MMISIKASDWKNLHFEKPKNGQECLVLFQDETLAGGIPTLLNDEWDESGGFFYAGDSPCVLGWIPLYFELPLH